MKKNITFCVLFFVLSLISSTVYSSAETAQIYLKPLPNLSLTLDPQIMEDTYSFHVSSQIYDTLFKFDEFINLKPNLVESYQVSDNGQVIALSLKKNIKFHNSRALSADDVIYTIQRFIKNAYKRYPELLLINGAQEYISGKSPSVKGINKSSSWSLEISLSSPSPTFLMLLATPSTGIMPADFNNIGISTGLPIGTGPFKVVSFEKDKEIVLKANKDYFNGPPKLDGIIYKYATRDQAIEGFNKGIFHDLEWYNPKPEEIKVSYSVAKFPMPRTAVLLFNTRTAPFNNKDARKAFTLAINKPKLMSECFSDKVEANGFIPYGLGGYDRTSKDYVFNINESKKALESSKVNKNNPIKIIWLEHHPCSGKFSNLVDEDLSAVGFNPIFKYITYSEFSKVIFNTRDYNVIEVRLSVDFPDAISMLNYFRSNYQYNFPGFSSKEYDDILKKALRTVDKYERYKLYQEAQKMLKDEYLFINLYYDVESVIYQKNVSGVKTLPVAFLSLPLDSVYLSNN